MEIKKIVIPVVLLFLMVAAPLSATPSVTAEVKGVVDEVLRIVSDKEMKKPQNEQKRRDALKKAISVIFDYGEMAKRSMGRHWKERSPAEKKELVQLYETLLENSYANKIESYNQEKIVYLKETVEGEYAEVRSKVITAKRDEYSLDYRLMNEKGRWMIYDVVIEGVSLVSNYRTQFNNIIQRDGYGELVKKLRQKSKEITTP